MGVWMMSDKEKEVVEQYLKQPKMAKSISFWLQKEEITKMYPDDIFPNTKDFKERYITKIINRLPQSIIENGGGVIRECVLCKWTI